MRYEVSAGSVEEYGQTNYSGYVHWHFCCIQCGQRMRFTTRPAEYDCPRCQTGYRVDASGNIFRIKKIDAAIQKIDASSPPRDTNRSVQDRSHSKGVLGRISDALADASEEAHGKRLQKELQSTGESIKKLEDWVVERIHISYLAKKEFLESELPNWSIAGRIKMGLKLRDEARKQFDFNQAESHALWLAGAWLESGARNSKDAATVHDFLEKIADGRA